MLEYEIYTTEFDEEIKASDLVSEKERVLLAQFMQKQLTDHAQHITKPDDLRSIFNTSSLKNACVTLLLDNSGSLRGMPLHLMVTTVMITAEALNSANIPFEVLGFTTRQWKGGQSRKKWLENGRPMNPGRLNDLRHIQYKTIGESWNTAKPNLGVMMKEGLLKENIDGEAVLWAHKRQQAIGMGRRIIIKMSDGAPIDDSTMVSNPDNYLKDHLDVAEKLVRNDGTELYQINVRYDEQSSNAINTTTIKSFGDILPAISQTLCTITGKPTQHTASSTAPQAQKTFKSRLGPKAFY